MQITIDTSKLPPNLTEAQIYEVIELSLKSYIGDYEGCSSHTEQVGTATQVHKALIKPPEQVALNTKDRDYLRHVGKQRFGDNDYMEGWGENQTIRTKLKRLKLVTIKHYPKGRKAFIRGSALLNK